MKKEKKSDIKDINFTDRAPIRNHLLAYLLDILLLLVTTIGIYFLSLYSVTNPLFGFNDKKMRIKEIENQYSLNLSNNASWDEYEQVIKDFYLTFEEKIVTENKNRTGDDASIIHIYNVTVLQLPSKPTDANYKTNYYQYKKDESGFLVDEWGERIEGDTTFYYNNLRSLFQSEYKHLFNYLKAYNSEYLNLTNDIYNQQNITRLVAISVNFLILFIIIPLTNKNKQTIFDRIFHVARVNKKDSLLIKNYKVIFKPITLYLLPIIGVFLMNQYSFVILTIAPLFINILISFFSKNNQELVEMIFKEVAIDTKVFPIAKTKEELSLLVGQIENSQDDEYIEKLSNADPINLKNDK